MHDQLTPRELQILPLIAQGYTDGEITQLVWLSRGTVKLTNARMYTKLGARNRSHAVAIAYERGLLPLIKEDQVA